MVFSSDVRGHLTPLQYRCFQSRSVGYKYIGAIFNAAGLLLLQLESRKQR